MELLPSYFLAKVYVFVYLNFSSWKYSLSAFVVILSINKYPVAIPKDDFACFPYSPGAGFSPLRTESEQEALAKNLDYIFFPYHFQAIIKRICSIRQISERY
ncbi:hypothetical protein JET18_21835 [Chryseobacterium sp. L7]|uniref:Uncharacterized protein n=1 Tax=Chryseobacterium endalhagicum TaxID=2797638 RepID=A0ABS1QLH0_9FLAO|nr:hypothetical protein [Chryseobacterium endalhagicum]MBL1223478.1 hypothetical protein [Chryseobacterium endalhagicum]